MKAEVAQVPADGVEVIERQEETQAEIDELREETETLKESVEVIVARQDLLDVPLKDISEEPVKPLGDVLTFTMNGSDYEYQSFVDAHYSRPWTYPGGIDSHLREHGVLDTSHLSQAQKEKLHAAIHEQELIHPVSSQSSVTTTRTTAPSNVVRYSTSNCPGGVCPSPNWNSYSYSNRSRRLFRRRR